jgi:hypothetical protein
MTSKRPSRKQLAEFEKFWNAEKRPYMRRGCTKEDLLAHYVWLWEGAGCPKQFIPGPKDAEFNITAQLDQDHIRDGGATVEKDIRRYDQDVLPNRGWILT